MARRVLASFLLLLGSLAATVAYGTWSLQATVLDADTGADLARALLEAEPVKQELVDDLAGQLGEALPEGSLTEDELAAAVDEAVSDPRFTAAFASAFAAMHRAVLDGDEAGDITIDGRGLDAAVRDALGAIDPVAAEALPQNPDLVVTVERSRIPSAGGLKDSVPTILAVSAVLALALLALGVHLHPDRLGALRRTGRRFALLGGSGLVLLVGAPLLLRLGDDSAESMAPVVEVLTSRLVLPAAVFAGLGAALWAGARLWVRRDLAEGSLLTAPVAASPPTPSLLAPSPVFGPVTLTAAPGEGTLIPGTRPPHPSLPAGDPPPLVVEPAPETTAR